MTEVKNLDLMLEAAHAVVKKVKGGEAGLKMSWWNTFDSERVQVTGEHVEEGSCGTSACFAGHMPFLGIPGLEVQEEDFWGANLCHDDYIQRLFGVNSMGLEWSWFFSPDMSDDVDLLLKRVEYYCEHERVPTLYEWKSFGFNGDIDDLGDFNDEH